MKGSGDRAPLGVSRSSMRRTSGSKPRIVDLFCGAGLLSAAFKAEHFEPVFAIDSCAPAGATYRRNLGDHIEIGDISKRQPEGSCEVLLAGPPCQGFSTLNRGRKRDQRNRLCLEVARWAEQLRPQVVVIENVEAFLSSTSSRLLRRRLAAAGYEIAAGTLDAAEFGVAQHRSRSFVIAATHGLPALPRPTRRTGKPIEVAWDGLAATPDGRNQHIAPKPSEIALSRMRVIPPGGDRRDIIERAPQLAAPSWLRLGCQATDCWGRMAWGRPSNTLRTALLNASKGRYIHPEQHRVISLREAARLQGIPDRFQFEGTPYQVARQIGNGVPIPLGRAVARQVSRLLHY